MDTYTETTQVKNLDNSFENSVDLDIVQKKTNFGEIY